MSDARIWAIIIALGIGTYLIRFSFIGAIGDRRLPPFANRLLRYVPVAVLPALVTPLILAPAATGGQFDPARAIAAAAALAFGAWRRSVLGAILAGMLALYLGLWALP